VDTEPSCGTITLPEGSWGEGGFHYVWLNRDNVWTWKRLYPAERRLASLAAKSPSGRAGEIALQAARELLLAEASDWQFLISTFAARDYAELRFADHIDRFERLADLAEAAQVRPLSPEEEGFVRDCRQKDAPFPTLDLSLWRAPVATSGTA
jgi:1,4-alpha-glucan branching enzyme